MAKATRVHSTPRRTASKIKVKKLAKPASAESQEQRDQRHGGAFRDLESPVGEIYCMAEITADVAMNITRSPENEIAAFAICHLCEMVRDLHTKYRADLRAGEAVAS